MRSVRYSIAVLLGVALAFPISAYGADDLAPPPKAPAKPVPPAKPAAPVKPKKPAADPADALIADAVDKLTTEYEAAKKGGKLRAEADYFAPVPAALTPEKVIAAVAKPVSRDPALDAYVRWQLLGAVPGTVDAKSANKVIAMYRAAPRPMPRIGTDHDTRKVLNRMVQDRSVSDAQAKTAFDAAIDKWTAYNEPIYSFRNALMQKVTPSADAIIAGLADAADRYKAADPKAGLAQLEAVSQIVSLWAISDEAPSRQKVAVAEAVERLRKEQPVEYAVEVETGRGNRYLRFGDSQPSGSQLDLILESLRAGSGGGRGAQDKADKKGK
jgi:hypothetical protein